MSGFQLAQLNIARAKAPIESPVMAEFVANLDRVNALAEHSPGFVWRLKDDAGNAAAMRPIGPDRLVNISVWQDIDALRAFVFKSGHVEIMRRRAEWFERMVEAYLVLWWIPTGHVPSIEEAMARLEQLRDQGSTAQAFTFRAAFPPPGEVATGVEVANECPAT